MYYSVINKNESSMKYSYHISLFIFYFKKITHQKIHKTLILYITNNIEILNLGII